MTPANLARIRFSLLLGLIFFLAGSASLAEPPPQDPPAQVSVEAAPLFGDVVFGNEGRWVASDVTSGRLDWIAFNGNVVQISFLGVDAANLYTGAGRGFFIGPDANKVPMYGGYITLPTFKAMRAALPQGFLSQGGGLAVSPNGYGVALSRSLSSVFVFQKDYALPPITLTVPGSARAIDFGPGGNFYIGTSSGAQVLLPNFTVTPLPNYTGNTTAVKGCGGKLWFGGFQPSIDYLDWWESPGDDYLAARFRRFFTTPSQISSIDCGQNGTAIAVGSNRMLFYVDPNAAVPVRPFSIPGTGELIKVSVGPGTVPSGLILDSLGNLGNFTLPADIRYPSDSNSAPTRLPNLNLRTLF